jgi:naphthalene 1,2-dioxygenase ferredoxin component
MSTPDTDTWTAVGHLDDLDAEVPTLATIGETEVALCRVGEQVFAVNNVCTHAYARLSDGLIEGTEVFCPLHYGSFDVRTGEAIAPPCIDAVAAYAVKIEGGRIFVDVTRRPGGYEPV